MQLLSHQSTRKFFLVRRASTRNCRMSLTSLRCFQASATASVRRLRTTRIQTSVSDLGTRQRTNSSPLWTEFSIRGLHSSAGVYWTELIISNESTDLVTSYTTWKYHSSTYRNWVCCTCSSLLITLQLFATIQNQS